MLFSHDKHKPTQVYAEYLVAAAGGHRQRDQPAGLHSGPVVQQVVRAGCGSRADGSMTKGRALKVCVSVNVKKFKAKAKVTLTRILLKGKFRERKGFEERVLSHLPRFHF